MPYNTRRKSISLPGLGIHLPMTSAARAASAAASRASSSASGRPSSSSASPSVSATSPRSSASRSRSPDSHSHPSKRMKRSHGSVATADSSAIEQTPPPSPTPATSVEMSDVDTTPKKIDLEGINDDIVEGVITQLQATGNRPHLIKDLATVLAQSLSSVQHSANPCAIISSRLASYMKRTCWSAIAPCPIAKELETVHPRRTYYFLTTSPHQPIPSGSVQQPTRISDITPSVSLTDDSGSDEQEERRRQLSPSPEIDLPRPDFYDANDFDMPLTPLDSMPKYPKRNVGDLPRDLCPLEKDEREFTQTADTLLKRKFNEAGPLLDTAERAAPSEYGYRDDLWFSDNNIAAFLTSPAMKPSVGPAGRKEDEGDNWLKLNKLYEWDQGAESIEIDELDGLLEGC